MKIETYYQIIEVFPESKTIVFYWKPSTQFMTEEEFVKELQLIARTMAANAPIHNVLLKTKDMNFIITPPMEDKLNEILIPVYKASGVKRLAVVMPEEMLMQIAVESTIEAEKPRHTFTTRYFKDCESAKKWLKVEKKFLIS